MTAFNRIVKWVQNQRSSTRMGFVLQIICRVLTSVFSLVWTPLLLGSMGKALNGIFLSFQSLASLGGLGDLGMGGLVNVQTSRLLGQDKEPELRAFLAAVRALFLVMTVVAGVVYLAVSPSVFSWLKFESVATLVPITGLAIVGALAAALLILNSYISNLNYGVGNVFWPVIPAFLILQLGIFGHCILARQHCPLWLQYVPYVVSALFTFAMGWWYHPAFPSGIWKRSTANIQRETIPPTNRKKFLVLFGLRCGWHIPVYQPPPDQRRVRTGNGADISISIFAFANWRCLLSIAPVS